MLRLRLGKSQETFASELDISNSALSRYENDLRVPDALFLKTLREAAGVELNWLICSEGPIFPPVPKNASNKVALTKKIAEQLEELRKLLKEYDLIK